jgi:hypothetical protein
MGSGREEGRVVTAFTVNKVNRKQNPKKKEAFSSCKPQFQFIYNYLIAK